jgi:hypothetical protein
MNLFGNDLSAYANSANASEVGAFKEAQNYMSPYTQNAGNDFNQGRQWLYSGMQKFGSQPNYNQNFYKYLNMSPSQLLTQAMSGYQESPFMKDEMQYAQSGANNKMIQQGMGGSSENALLDAEIGNILGGQDISNYLGELMKSFNTQQGILHTYNNEAKGLAGLFQDMLGTENKSSNAMASNAMRMGGQESQNYNEEERNSVTQQRNNLHALGSLLNDMTSLYGDHEGNKRADQSHQDAMQNHKDMMGLISKLGMAAMFM